MPEDFEKQFRDLRSRMDHLVERVVRLAKILRENEFERATGLEPSRDDDIWVRDYNQTLRKIDELASQQEDLLVKAGLLKKT